MLLQTLSWPDRPILARIVFSRLLAWYSIDLTKSRAHSNDEVGESVRACACEDLLDLARPACASDGTRSAGAENLDVPGDMAWRRPCHSDVDVVGHVQVPCACPGGLLFRRAQKPAREP